MPKSQSKHSLLCLRLTNKDDRKPFWEFKVTKINQNLSIFQSIVGILWIYFAIIVYYSNDKDILKHFIFVTVFNVLFLLL